MTPADRLAFRATLIAGPTDCPLSVEEACAFVGWSESFLMASTCPRGKEKGRVYFMKSQINAWLLAQMPFKVEKVA